ncbi:PadR family transcriptional regulator [Spongiactinospora sp. TRM90649]|uniref:PadR family transcriptional regulator n=1 Tax=Spongiactinospora sp. TRM90649 TaxID=3031114 RepID=UPI0023F78CC4|nr:PadR family transcriptional regulator [Spongiactinospora sp. TRM90649]MDF5757930.1 PadR family transcriptional regulator [Spongiactinospora sp. TRM90649]
MSSTHAMGGQWAQSDPCEMGRQVRRTARSAMRLMAAAWQQGGGPGGPRGGGPHEHRARGGHRGGPFPFDFGRGLFGPGFQPGGRHFGRARKAKRGDVRAAILALLAEEPRNGYQIIQEIGERSQGGWRPSPGAVYPALQQLADEGLVRAEESEGRKTFQLTEEGRAYVTEHPDEVRAPWEEMVPDVDSGTWELMDTARQSAFAMMQILQTGSEAQIREARQTLIETRRKLYRILAEGDPSEE